MKLSAEDRKIIVARELEKAESFMVQAEGNFVMGYWDTVANRMYYAMFHAVIALLVNAEIQTGATHKGIVSQFGLKFVKTGIFTKEEGSLYSQLQSMREKADYYASFQSSEEELSLLLPQAKAMLAKIKQIIQA